jgi:MFS transporter, DHA3 family, tetracycline resistance protein
MSTAGGSRIPPRRRGRGLSPAVVYITLESVTGFAYYMMGTIYTVYLVLEAHLSPLQLVLLGTVLEATVLLFEVPTGILADTFGRRASVIIGVLLMGLGFGALGLTTSFWPIALTQITWGIGATFMSGAQEAWITDEVGEHPAARLFVRGAQAAQASGIVGIALSVVLATISLALPLIVSGLVGIGLAICLVVGMSEKGFVASDAERPRVHDSIAGTIKSSVAQVRAKPVLLLIFAVAALHGASTEGFDRLFQVHFIENTGLPSLGGLDRVLWFGVIDGGGLLLAIAASEFVKRRVDVTSHSGAARALALIYMLLVAGVVAFGLTTSFAFALLTFWLVTMLREINLPIYAAWINQGLDPRSRATINSVGSQVDALGQMSAGPGLGFVAVARSVQAAIVVSGLLRLPALGLFARALRRGSVGTVSPDEMETVPLQVDKVDVLEVNVPHDRPFHE